VDESKTESIRTRLPGCKDPIIEFTQHHSSSCSPKKPRCESYQCYRQYSQRRNPLSKRILLYKYWRRTIMLFTPQSDDKSGQCNFVNQHSTTRTWPGKENALTCPFKDNCSPSLNVPWCPFKDNGSPSLNVPWCPFKDNCSPSLNVLWCPFKDNSPSLNVLW
jgi:hypothetical protein